MSNQAREPSRLIRQLLLLPLIAYYALVVLGAWPADWRLLGKFSAPAKDFIGKMGIPTGMPLFRDPREPIYDRLTSYCLEVRAFGAGAASGQVLYRQPECDPPAFRWVSSPISLHLTRSLFAVRPFLAREVRSPGHANLASVSEYFCGYGKSDRLELIWDRSYIQTVTLVRRRERHLRAEWDCASHRFVSLGWDKADGSVK